MNKPAHPLLVPALLVLGAALWRLVPAFFPDMLWGWANFAPVGALALFGAARLRPTWLGFGLPVAAMLVSDVLLGAFMGQWEYAIHGTTPFVYGAFVLCGLLGPTLRGNDNWQRVVGTGAGASVLFFFVTNIGAWLTMPQYYSFDFSGLLLALEMGLPFHKATFVGDMLFTVVLFGAAGWAAHPRTTNAQTAS